MVQDFPAMGLPARFRPLERRNGTMGKKKKQKKKPIKWRDLTINALIDLIIGIILIIIGKYIG